MGVQGIPGIKLTPDFAFPVSPLAGGLFGDFRDWHIAQFRGLEETCGLLATAGDNPNPETPSFLSLFFDPWIPCLLFSQVRGFRAPVPFFLIDSSFFIILFLSF